MDTYRLSDGREIPLGGGLSVGQTPDGIEYLDVAGAGLGSSALHADSHANGGTDEISIDASQVVSGILNVARIPDLDAAKLVSGTLVRARLPSQVAYEDEANTFIPGQLIQGAAEEMLRLERTDAGRVAQRFRNTSGTERNWAVGIQTDGAWEMHPTAAMGLTAAAALRLSAGGSLTILGRYAGGVDSSAHAFTGETQFLRTSAANNTMVFGQTGDSVLRGAFKGNSAYEFGGTGAAARPCRLSGSSTEVLIDTPAGAAMKLRVSGELEVDGALNIDSTLIGFYSGAPVAQPAALVQTYATSTRTLAAYTADTEGVAYTGAADGEAKLADLNALRIAYENLRAFVENLAQFHNAHVDDHQSMALVL
jgi:hypothetical protein